MLAYEAKLAGIYRAFHYMLIRNINLYYDELAQHFNRY